MFKLFTLTNISVTAVFCIYISYKYYNYKRYNIVDRPCDLTDSPISTILIWIQINNINYPYDVTTDSKFYKIYKSVAQILRLNFDKFIIVNKNKKYMDPNLTISQLNIKNKEILTIYLA